MMTNVYANAEDQNVVGRILYADMSSKQLFYDKAKTKRVPAAELKDLFIKGFVIDDNTDVIFIPMCFRHGSDGVGGYVFAMNGTATNKYLSAELDSLPAQASEKTTTK